MLNNYSNNINKISATILGLLLIRAGIEVIREPVVHSYKYMTAIDLTGYNREFGCLMIFIGVLILYVFLVKSRE